MLILFRELKPKKGIDYSRDHLRRKVKAKEFPEPVPISDRRIAWIESEVDDWVAARVAERDGRAG
jgi:prophage regulatory protein